MKWGILSTADINRKLLAGAAESDDVEVVAVGSRDLARAEEYARTWGIERAYGTLRRAARRPRRRGGLHPAAEHDAQRVVDPGARGGQARALREAVQPPHRRRRGGVRRRRADGTASSRRRSCTATTRRPRGLPSSSPRGRSASCASIRSAFSYSLYDADNIRLRTDVEGGALMDVGCYCISGSRLLGGEPGVGLRGRPHRLERHGLGLHGPDALSRTTSSALFDCGTSLAEPRRARGDRDGGLALPRRPVALPEAGDRAAAGRRRSSGSRSRPRTRTGSSSRI